MFSKTKEKIIKGNITLGIEFGSTQIKGILLDDEKNIIASGVHRWENEFSDGYWTYKVDSIINGMQEAYLEIHNEILNKYQVKITKIARIGISAMMHGYVACDDKYNLLVPFRTWRNTTTNQAASELSERLNYNIPVRWSISHLYQAILNKELHLKQLKHVTTLAGYIHYRLTGSSVLGIGEASGMFPVTVDTLDYNQSMVIECEKLFLEHSYDFKIKNIFPKILVAGKVAGTLTESGAKLLDKTNNLKPGSLFCPPEGDAGTGMVSTNSISKNTGNVSAGTSLFLMLVLEKELSKPYKEIDMVQTPSGLPVAMVHCNNCTSDINAWVDLFHEFSVLSNSKLTKSDIYKLLYDIALDSKNDAGGMVSFNYLSGESITNIDDGVLLFMRNNNSHLNLANFIRNMLYSAVSTLKIGLEVIKDEDIRAKEIYGHGGFFRNNDLGAKIMASTLNSKVTVFKNSDMGGANGIALLADYLNHSDSYTLDEYLNTYIFNDMESYSVEPEDEITKGLNEYYDLYKKTLEVEKTASKYFKK